MSLGVRGRKIFTSCSGTWESKSHKATFLTPCLELEVVHVSLSWQSSSRELWPGLYESMLEG
jgi:hypothetical protein